MINFDSTWRRRFIKRLDAELTAFIVLVYGLLIILVTLVDLVHNRHYERVTSLNVDLPLFIGSSLIYLSVLLRRLKRTAWLATLVAFAFNIGANIEGLTDIESGYHGRFLLLILRLIVLPLLIIILLLINHKRYSVRSDIQGFRSATITSLIILSVAFVYGTIGFLTLGKKDFHQSLSIPAAMHYSLDQLDITTNHPIHAYTKKAVIFQDSLGVISFIAVIYALTSFFQPLKARFRDQSAAREYFNTLLIKQHDSRSEDFFKLWPLDKYYFFDSTRTSGVAFGVSRGIALILGGPTGKRARFKQLLGEFQYVCSGNDWRPAIIHSTAENIELYEELGYKIQKIGEEAVVELDNFNSNVVRNKYFRNVVNKFSKAGYSFDLLTPPIDPAVMERLRQISNQWLSQGNRTERGFALGYFQEAYLNHCNIGIAKDNQGVIQAFINLVPAEDFDHEEATYDLLRSSNEAMVNTNDFLLINLMDKLSSIGYSRLNLGLCPLSGLGEDNSSKENSLIDYLLSLAYHNGDRLYSFSGLYRFKNKYEPKWQDSYVAYQGGVAGFSKAMTAVMALMRQGAKHPSKRFI